MPATRILGGSPSQHEIKNVTLKRNGKTYRVAFRGERALCVMRKTSTGREVALDMAKETSGYMIREARRELSQIARKL